MSQSERRLAAMMFTDIVGYTALTQSDESHAMGLLEKHNQILRPLFPRFNGREIKTIGDAFMVEFDSALDAVRCAAEAQSRLHEYNVTTEAGWKISVRIGIHLGDVIHQKGDVFGDAVNIASRIQSIAGPEGICISGQVYDQVHNKFELPLLSLGERSLKNVSTPTLVYRVVMPWMKEKALRLERKRVAVLPLASMSPDPNDEYFADGMTEEIIASVSRMKGLSVISRTSVMQYKNTQKTVSEISGELGVGTLVEGSVLKVGDRVRITVQLIDAEKDEHKWAGSWSKNVEDIFTVQDEIAKKIASSLKVQLTGYVRLKSKVGRKEAAEAYDLYLKAWHRMQETTETTDTRTLGYLQTALKLDPTSALVHNGIAWYYFANVELSIPKEEGWPKVKKFAERALSLDPDLSEAHLVTALAEAQHGWNWGLAEKEFKEAIRSNPSNSEAMTNYGLFLVLQLGLFAEAEPYFRKAEELDPWNVHAKGDFAWLLYLTRRYSDAEAKIMEMREIRGTDWAQAMVMARVFLETSRPEKALEETRKLEEHSGYSYRLGHAGYMYGVLGRREEAQRVLQKLLNPAEGSPLDFALSMVYLGLGDKGEALKRLEKACDEQSYAIIINYQIPEIQQLKPEPGFKRIEDKVGIAAFVASRERRV